MLYLGDAPAKALEEAALRGVAQHVEELALIEAYGSRRDYLNAPTWHVARTRFVLAGRAKAQQKLAGGSGVTPGTTSESNGGGQRVVTHGSDYRRSGE